MFGSNLAGRHGKGAALAAVRDHGAIYGQGIGLQGSSYAIPTKDRSLQPLPLHVIRSHVNAFLEFAENNPDMEFDVTRVGCGLAGYKDEQIAPMFADIPMNVFLPPEWEGYLRD